MLVCLYVSTLATVILHLDHCWMNILDGRITNGHCLVSRRQHTSVVKQRGPGQRLLGPARSYMGCTNP